MKRRCSGLSCVLAIEKPVGMSSHDVVNLCRRVFGSTRVGHCGTLDPLAAGVLIVCIGPSTRLENYIVGHAKSYDFSISFGCSTTTDDAGGDILKQSAVPEEFKNFDFANEAVASIVGIQMQVPPAYSAIKVDGKKACSEARKGNNLKLKAREVEIVSAKLLGIEQRDLEASTEVIWNLSTCVTSGTYIRSIARDLGEKLACPAHISSLVRTKCSSVGIESCLKISEIESLLSDEHNKLEDALLFARKNCIDPASILGFEILMVDESILKKIENGNAIDISCILGSSAAHPHNFEDGKKYLLADENLVYAIYEFIAESAQLKSCCKFSIGVLRG